MDHSKEESPSTVPTDPPKLRWLDLILRFRWLRLFIILLLSYPARYATSLWRWPAPNLEPRAAPPLPMKVFQMHPPVRVDRDYLPGVVQPQQRKECEVLLIQHEFKFSYGKPAIGYYTPPSCDWTHVMFTLTITSRGRQYDRLAVLFLGDVEVWRTSTAEPTWYGIEFGYTKDMTAFSSLLRKPQKLIFDLGNLVNDIYTGTFNTTLKAIFHTPLLSVEETQPSVDIFPISSARSAQGQASYFYLPRDPAVSRIQLPQNTIRATVSISASGNEEEEFWYTNVPSPFAHTFPSSPLPGHSAFREIQVLVDGRLIGVAWPYPVIFTGGINPLLWRPIVGISTFDVPTYEIDVTAYLPMILGKVKDWEIRVVSHDPASGDRIGSNWVVTGRVFVWTDPDPSWVTTGTINHMLAPEPKFEVETLLQKDIQGRNITLQASLEISRSLSVSSTINTSSGVRRAIWTQGLSFTSKNTLTNNGANQSVTQTTSGSSFSTSEDKALTCAYTYPLQVNSSYELMRDGGFSIATDVYLAVDESDMKPGVLLLGRRGHVTSSLLGSATYNSAGRVGSGATEQIMNFNGNDIGEVLGSYWRKVRADRGKLIQDEEWVNGRKVPRHDGDDAIAGVVDESPGGRSSVRKILGRGPKDYGVSPPFIDTAEVELLRDQTGV